jgi:hypothetical protein
MQYFSPKILKMGFLHTKSFSAKRSKIGYTYWYKSSTLTKYFYDKKSV